MPDSRYFIGLISGTSIDAVDCVVVSFSKGPPALVATHTHCYEDQLRKDIFTLCEQPEVSLKLLGETSIAIAKTFTDAVRKLLNQAGLDSTQITAIGSHGQTVFHNPDSTLPFTLQIGDPNKIALMTGIQTVADLRGKDMAAGGQGAPLASLFHREFFQDEIKSRVIVNLGGIANISIIAKGYDYLGYDTGPASVLMDYWISKFQDRRFDQNGEWAAEGTVNGDLLELLLDEPYFSAAEPKSTGREYFNGQWLENRLALLDKDLAPVDVQATLLELTASTLVTEIENQLTPDEVLVCGGGAHNRTLLKRIAELLPDCKVDTTDAEGLAPDWVEAVTFAWLAMQRIDEIPIDTCSVTGASRPVILGGLYLPD